MDKQGEFFVINAYFTNTSQLKNSFIHHKTDTRQLGKSLDLLSDPKEVATSNAR